MNFPVPWRVLLPVDAVAVVGRALPSICDATGACVEVSADGDTPKTLSDKICTISGSVEQKEAGCRRVVDHLRELQSVADQEPGVFVIIVPACAAPVVVGMKGSQIKEVIELSGAEISVGKENILGMPDQPIGVTGTGGQVVSAVSKVNAILQDLADRGRLQPGDFKYRPGAAPGTLGPVDGMGRSAPAAPGNPRTHLRFVVTTQVAGWIIGKQGRHIRELQENSGSHIQIMKEGEVPPGVSPVDRIIEIGGRYDAKADGIQIVLMAIDSMPALSAPRETLILLPHVLSTDLELQDIRVLSGSEVEKRDLPNHHETLCTVIGTVESRVKAAQHILKRLEDVMQDGSGVAEELPKPRPSQDIQTQPVIREAPQEVQRNTGTTNDPWSNKDPWSVARQSPTPPGLPQTTQDASRSMGSDAHAPGGVAQNNAGFGGREEFNRPSASPAQRSEPATGGIVQNNAGFGGREEFNRSGVPPAQRSELATGGVVQNNSGFGGTEEFNRPGVPPAQRSEPANQDHFRGPFGSQAAESQGDNTRHMNAGNPSASGSGSLGNSALQQNDRGEQHLQDQTRNHGGNQLSQMQVGDRNQQTNPGNGSFSGNVGCFDVQASVGNPPVGGRGPMTFEPENRSVGMQSRPGTQGAMSFSPDVAVQPSNVGSGFGGAASNASCTGFNPSSAGPGLMGPLGGMFGNVGGAAAGPTGATSFSPDVPVQPPNVGSGFSGAASNASCTSFNPSSAGPGLMGPLGGMFGNVGGAAAGSTGFEAMGMFGMVGNSAPNDAMFRQALQNGAGGNSNNSQLALLYPQEILQRVFLSTGALADIAQKCQIRIDLGAELPQGMRQLSLHGSIAANSMAAYFLQERVSLSKRGVCSVR